VAVDVDGPASVTTAIEEVESSDLADNDTEVDDDSAPPTPPPNRIASPVFLATIVGLVTVVALAGLGGWLGFRAYRSHQAVDQRNVFVEAARQGALNLTTIDWHQADADIARIMSSSIGTFYDDFAQRSQPFVDVVKKTRSITVGTITEAGLESDSPDEAQVLVAVSVKTSSSISPEPQQRNWRMRISVQKVGDDVKVSTVEFVQ
jgi:Mce-associated membrane protein